MAIDMENQNFLQMYSKNDVTELAFKTVRYMENISAEIPGAKTAYDSFIQEARNAERKTLAVCFSFLFMLNTVLLIGSMSVYT